MKRWKEVEREIVAELLREIAAKSSAAGVREFIERHCTSQTEFYRIWARYKGLVFEQKFLQGRLERKGPWSSDFGKRMLERFYAVEPEPRGGKAKRGGIVTDALEASWPQMRPRPSAPVSLEGIIARLESGEIKPPPRRGLRR